MRDQLNSPAELIWPKRAFWQTWNGQPGVGQSALLGIYLLLLATGLAAAFQKNGLPGLLPLALSLVYNAWTALFLSSGDRFLVPMDWAAYLYLFLGLLTLVNFFLRGNFSNGDISGVQGKTDLESGSAFRWRSLGLTTFFILLCGASIPLTEVIFPKIYPNLKAPALTQPALSSEISLHGRAIYPRWYDAKDGEPGTAKLGYGEMDQARLVFFLVGEKNSLVIFPAESPPRYFPNASDVTIEGTLEDGYLRAKNIVVQKDGISAEYSP